MNSFKLDPYLWIHFTGLAVAPFFLGLVWIALGVGTPFPFFWLELILVASLGIIPIFLMQWNRPFYIFSFLVIALNPEAITSQEKMILSLFKTKKQLLLVGLTTGFMLLIFWFLYRFSPLTIFLASQLPQWRILGLFIASVAFLLANLFVFVPVSVLGVISTSPEQFALIEPLETEKIKDLFTIIGFPVKKILPAFTQEKSLTTTT